MAHPEFEHAKKRAELISELSGIVKQQVYGEMDWVRARAYWDARLPSIETALLAEALSYALSNAAKCCGQGHQVNTPA